MGLDKLEIIESEVTSALTLARSLTNSLRDSSSKAKSLLSKVESSGWKGETKESFVAYLTILQQYHEDIYQTSKKQTKALEAIPTGMAGYEAHGEVGKVKSL